MRKKAREFSTASVDITGAEIGWQGPQGGRTIEITFWKDRERTARHGALRISEASIQWKLARGNFTEKRKISVARLLEALEGGRS